MKILITGGAGFIGNNLANKLCNEGYEIISIDLKKEPYLKLENKHYKYISGNILNKKLISELIKVCDIIIHCAVSSVLEKSIKTIYKNNIEGTKNLLEEALFYNMKQFIFISSGCVYGIPCELPIREETPRHPFEPYGWSKYFAENLCYEFRKKGLNIVIIRLPNVLGEGRLGVMSILFEWLQSHKSIYLIGNGNNKYQFLSFIDFYTALKKIIEKNISNEDFNLGTDKFSTVEKDLHNFIKSIHSESKIKKIPSFIAKTLLILLDKTYLSPLSSWHYTIADKSFYFDISKAKTLLDWQPQYSNSQMLKMAYEWYVINKNFLTLKEGTTNSTIVNQKVLKLLKLFS
ncbi:MAG: NAD(P)-dependent oxidoreductase [Candidatus Pacearchaeota archaeon]